MRKVCPIECSKLFNLMSTPICSWETYWWPELEGLFSATATGWPTWSGKFQSPPTRFNIASMTKQFTAGASLLLEDRGKLKTDDLVKKYLTDAPASWDKITIYHLLTHTSGISDDAA